MITALEDIYTLDGTLRYSAGEVVDTITTGSDGMATSKELYLGRYVITETHAPFGMTLNTETVTVELVYAGQEVKLTETSAGFYNERQKVQISLEKSMETDKLFDIGANGEIANVTFALWQLLSAGNRHGRTLPTEWHEIPGGVRVCRPKHADRDACCQ